MAGHKEVLGFGAEGQVTGIGVATVLEHTVERPFRFVKIVADGQRGGIIDMLHTIAETRSDLFHLIQNEFCMLTFPFFIIRASFAHFAIRPLLANRERHKDNDLQSTGKWALVLSARREKDKILRPILFFVLSKLPNFVVTIPTIARMVHVRERALFQHRIDAVGRIIVRRGHQARFRCLRKQLITCNFQQ